ncbi:bifunctional methylenetetrahydrofolate dehydrogenase/methenyltetrahydrofolate cyclohydrolase FolD [Aneurinibacillus sp. Ricciae_BoGa-3]|uniref:bifunctional methylenetetrahydrofolate dehydrogenase/methenyltetrahydrofolate cyclohydrolase FolD n=1 Tax=Aneurinibacillus sp. Ricciae_BoGa-3 TaxID=3022697 RepID=UPI0023405524|nr:bifunctional methylenetetrahydrofolate dehydrogenase/methenyltetrahydrofolate cyclohydrolase FolD [Aneurinibacillus sp. Ricciae_BoGa-3]WCK53141.1 bifunctional methylenetetrahydrofolate dehydrogenase/methenyltetrahydrofolate cyclohydrolase FolD [Aneurinibacillus sp. Ricciae_BoGa-3]
MAAHIISGKEVAADIRKSIKEQVDVLRSHGVIPGLTVILVGEDPASESYVRGKEKACGEVGIASEIVRRNDSITQEQLLAELDRLNADPAVHGILVQLPLPAHIDEKAVINRIRPDKDVDGFHPINVGNMVVGDDCYLPCTPHGIIELIKRSGQAISGKQALVVGRSNIVGKPVSMLLLRENATVTIAHSRTEDLSALVREADIVVAAVGRPQMIKGSDIKPGAIVIDVGVNRLETGKLVGDVDFESAKDIAGYITPVPGGVGPMTITMLLKNTVDAAKKLNGII